MTAPAEYGATHVPGAKVYVLRFEAQHAGPFDAHATWTAQYKDDLGVVWTCDASGVLTLDAEKGRPLALRQPLSTGKHQWDDPIIWKWHCLPDSDPIPRSLTIKWEVDKRELPLFFRGGNPPFRLSKRAKTLRASTADPCDGHQVGGFTKKRLAKNATLSVILGGNAETGAGGLLVKFGGEFRLGGRRGNIHPLHLGIVLKEGSRTLINAKVCAWQQTGFEIASHSGVSCWRK